MKDVLQNAIHCLRVVADQAACEDCSLYPCDHTDVANITRVAINALEQQLSGATLLPCKPGDAIFRIVRVGKHLIDIRERIVSSVEYNAAGEWVIHSTGDDVLGKTCFFTYEEAEMALLKGNKS